jgi:hypothetical protein
MVEEDWVLSELLLHWLRRRPPVRKRLARGLGETAVEGAAVLEGDLNSISLAAEGLAIS